MTIERIIMKTAAGRAKQFICSDGTKVERKFNSMGNVIFQRATNGKMKCESHMQFKKGKLVGWDKTTHTKECSPQDITKAKIEYKHQQWKSDGFVGDEFINTRTSNINRFDFRDGNGQLRLSENPIQEFNKTVEQRGLTRNPYKTKYTICASNELKASNRKGKDVIVESTLNTKYFLHNLKIEEQDCMVKLGENLILSSIKLPNTLENYKMAFQKFTNKDFSFIPIKK